MVASADASSQRRLEFVGELGGASMQIKTRLGRMMLFDGVLTLGAIALAAALVVLGLGRQRGVTELLYAHPFMVSNAALDLRTEVLELRNGMLEAALQDRVADGFVAEVRARRAHIASDLAVLHASFLGDSARVDAMGAAVAAWNAEQDATLADLAAGRVLAARARSERAAHEHVAALLLDDAYVIDFARRKAAMFASAGEGDFRRASALVAVGASLLCAGYVALFARRWRAKQDLLDQLQRQAMFDDLTGAYNRRTFIEVARLEIERAMRSGQSLSLIAIDIDHFKRVNDAHGHAAGDAALRGFCAGCRQILRRIDALGRIGGEEFAVLLPGAGVREARDIAERIRAATEQTPVPTADGDVRITISAGVALLALDTAGLDALLSEADAALYQAKHGGRNVVVLAPGLQADAAGAVA